MPMSYDSPDNLVELLGGIVSLASQTRFFGPRLRAGLRLRSLEEFAALPVTTLGEYRRQRLADVLAQPGRVEGIVGPYRGQDPGSVAVTEGADESAERFDLFIDAVRGCVDLETGMVCAVLADVERRYFAAEIATILIRSGAIAHVFVDQDSSRLYEMARLVEPEILVLLTDVTDPTRLPPSTSLCVTFRRFRPLEGCEHLDILLVDELGSLGQSRDGTRYTLNSDSYHFERSERGRLIVTSLFNRVQPLVRIETEDVVGPLEGGPVELRPSR